MNNARRKRIETIIGKLSELRAELDEIKDEEQGVLDNLPENMQSGDKASRYEEIIDGLETASSDLENIEDSLNETIQ